VIHCSFAALPVVQAREKSLTCVATLVAGSSKIAQTRLQQSLSRKGSVHTLPPPGLTAKDGISQLMPTGLCKVSTLQSNILLQKKG